MEILQEFEPHRRLLWAYEYWAKHPETGQRRYGTLGDIITYQVPMPHLRLLGRKLWKSDDQPRLRRIEFSHDGQTWQPAYLPHVTAGEISDCVQKDAPYDFDNPAANLFDWTISYVMGGVRGYWHPLIAKDDWYDYHAKTFMEPWEELSVQDVLDHLAKKAV